LSAIQGHFLAIKNRKRANTLCDVDHPSSKPKQPSANDQTIPAAQSLSFSTLAPPYEDVPGMKTPPRSAIRVARHSAEHLSAHSGTAYSDPRAEPPEIISFSLPPPPFRPLIPLRRATISLRRHENRKQHITLHTGFKSRTSVIQDPKAPQIPPLEILRFNPRLCMVSPPNDASR
jgi:hypothetical protein